MSDISTAGQAHQLLGALAEQLTASGHAYELVVIGGSALLAAGVIDRPTQDVDVLALRSGDRLLNADPLPPELRAARDRVSRDFGVAESWLNAGPTRLLDLGLPVGLIGRLNTRRYGAALTVHFASRLDQIHFKLYAFVDQGPGKHEADLCALEPTRDELIQAARWSRTHDPSPGFAQLLGHALTHLGVEDADLGT
jgi:hypothetical protein